MRLNKEMIQGLLGDVCQYGGLVCTDWGIVEGFGALGIEMFEVPGWGVDDLDVKARAKKVIDAGVDQFCGNMNTEELLELIAEGKIAEASIDESDRRILRTEVSIGTFR
jgi:beta-glucosidase